MTVYNESTSLTIPSVLQNQEESNTRVRLTNIRHLARTSTSRISNDETPVIVVEEGEHNNDIEREHNHTDQVRRPRRLAIRYNCGGEHKERYGVSSLQLASIRTCPHCNARLFHCETFAMCCSNGKIILPLIPSLPEMMQLFSDQTYVGRKFRQNIRAYNNVFAFTSMGVHLDTSLQAQNRGVYTFRAQGSIYYKIGGLLPQEGARLRYLQAYIYDTDHELDNRMTESTFLDRELVHKIQQILNKYNPFVHHFRSLGQRQDLTNCRLIIREQPADQRQYTLPSASQIAAIIVGVDGDDANPRDLVVQTISGSLRNVKDYVGYYDPMQYPLLLPYGTYG